MGLEGQHERILKVLHEAKDNDELMFSYPLLHEILALVIVPSKAASDDWAKVADQILIGDKVTPGIRQSIRRH